MLFQHINPWMLIMKSNIAREANPSAIKQPITVLSQLILLKEQEHISCGCNSLMSVMEESDCFCFTVAGAEKIWSNNMTKSYPPVQTVKLTQFSVD